jgi:hypothetical protein
VGLTVRSFDRPAPVNIFTTDGEFVVRFVTAVFVSVLASSDGKTPVAIAPCDCMRQPTSCVASAGTAALVRRIEY